MAELATRWERLAAVRDGAIETVRMRIPRPEDAEDLVHEALVRLAGRAVLDADNPGLRSLVVTTACGLAIDGWRRERRRQRLLARLGIGAAVSPESRVVDRSEAAWLAAGVPELGNMERAALLQAVAGAQVGEIAQQLGVGYKAAENALGRARRKLRLRAASAALGLVALLRKFASRSETAPVAAMVPALAVASLVLFGGGAAQGHSAPRAMSLQPAAAPGGSARLAAAPAGGASPAAHTQGSRGALRPAAATADSQQQPGGWHEPTLPLPPQVPVKIAPGPEQGAPLVEVAGFPLVSDPSTAFNVGPYHSWYQVTHQSCAAGSATCPPFKVG